MPWNRELPDWPKFHYDPERVFQLERQFLLSVGSELACLKTIDEEEYKHFVVEILSEEGSESPESKAKSSIKQHFGLQTTSKRSSETKTGELRHTRYRLNLGKPELRN